MTKIPLSCAILVASSAWAADLQLECPTRYPEGPTVLNNVPMGWDGQGRVNGALPLVAGSYAEGPISGRAYGEIIGGRVAKTKDGIETRYAINGQIKEKWVICRYGNEGTVELFHRVPAHATRCIINTVPRRFPGNPIVRITCE